ncbi:hypothetical protein LPJ74_001931 [Coemansia sp. RSA 1843]|nr:hypothetical protein LPJ74_001931 [Coemansia sp. RSA 1843]
MASQIPDDLTETEEVQWVDRLAEQLQSSHGSKCPWKGHECAEAMYSLPLATSRETVDNTCQFAADLLPFDGNLPVTRSPLSPFQRSLLCDLGPGALKIQETSSSSSSGNSDDCQNKRRHQPQNEASNMQVFSALVLSLFGWRVDKSISQPTVKCEMCFRSAGLWLFRSVADKLKDQSGEPITSDNVDGNGDYDDNNEKVARESGALSDFNVVSEHRSFCCWVYASKKGNVMSEDSAPLQSGSATGAILPGWQKVIGSILRAKAVHRTEEASSASDGDSDSDESESSHTDDDKGEGGHTSRQRTLSDLEHDTELDELKRFKPFNISAISSAAEAFGIPFSTSLLVRAARQLESHVLGKQQNSEEAVTTQDTNIDASENEIQIPLQDAWESDASIRLGIDEDTVTTKALESNPDDVDEDIPPPIDISGLSALLGDSTLASALEDPAKAQLILDYVKGLIVAKNQEAVLHHSSTSGS